jgi:hypothetical protein
MKGAQLRRRGALRISVHHHPLGRWEVITGDGREPISCETLEDARRIAYIAVAHARTCELIVRDEYNRILERELIEGHRPDARAARSRAGLPSPGPVQTDDPPHADFPRRSSGALP